MPLCLGLVLVVSLLIMLAQRPAFHTRSFSDGRIGYQLYSWFATGWKQTRNWSLPPPSYKEAAMVHIVERFLEMAAVVITLAFWPGNPLSLMVVRVSSAMIPGFTLSLILLRYISAWCSSGFISIERKWMCQKGHICTEAAAWWTTHRVWLHLPCTGSCTDRFLCAANRLQAFALVTVMGIISGCLQVYRVCYLIAYAYYAQQ